MKWIKWIFIIPAGLLALAVLTLLVLSNLPGAGKLHASIEIAAPRQKVWPWIDEGDKLKQWVSWLVDVRQELPRTPGSTQTWVMKDENNGGAMMSLAGRCTEYVPPSRLTIAINAPEYGFDGGQSYVLNDLGNGKTRLDIDGKYHFSQWFANLMTPLVMLSAKSKLERDIAQLKVMAER
jgi:uncharacterized protein YndB with AHSA1/START domain